MSTPTCWRAPKAWLAISLALMTFGASAAAEPVRVASLLPFVEDALAGDPAAEVVAAVRRSPHQPAAAEVDLGNPHAPSLEALATARPAVVVGDARIHARFAPQLGALGAELLLLEPSSVEATLAGLRELAGYLGTDTTLPARVDTAAEQLAGLSLAKPVPALALFGTPGSFYVLTGESWLGDLMNRMGFTLAGTEGPRTERFPGLVQLSDEVLVTLRPELVLLVAHGDAEKIAAGFERKLEGGGAWEGLRNAAHRGLHVLPAERFASNPGLGLPDAARTLRAIAEGGESLAEAGDEGAVAAR